MDQLWNDGRRFALLPLGSTYEDLRETAVTPVTLPHDWLIADTGSLYADGDGWYVKTLRLPPEAEGRTVMLDFDGVYMDADILLNGQVIRTHRYGYTAFQVNLTGLLRHGDNEVAVHIRHRSPNSRWYSGAGIWRDVRLLALPADHLVPGGLQVNTEPEGEGWRLAVDAELSLDAGEAPALNLRDTSGHALLSTCLERTGKEAHGAWLLRGIRPWCPEDPALYELTLTLCGEAVTRRIGFRKCEFTPDRGFLLNGKPIKLHGVCLHHDLGALGAAFHAPAAERQLRLMRAMGANAIRTSHNPPARALLDLCDRMGFLVDDELYDMWEMPKTAYDNARFFTDTWRESVAEWVRRDRWRPSVILWSIGNEIQDMHASERGQMWTRLLAEETRRHDSRHAPVTFGSNYMPWEGAQRCAEIVKLPGYNYAEKYYAAHHAAHPDWAIYGSETGSMLASRGIYHFPMRADILSEEDLQCSALLNSNTSWGAKDIRRLLADDLNTPWTLGQFIWAGIDYIGEPTPYHTRNCYFGQADTACFPKDSYYFYQAMWTDAPMAHIGVSWDWNAGQLIDVPVMTNGCEAELVLNGRSLGRVRVDRRDPERCLPVWQVPFEPGTLEARSYGADGRLLCTARRETPGEPARLQLACEPQKLTAASGGIAFVEVTVLDAQDRPVENAVNRVRAEVSGAGVLLGMDNGDSTDRDGYRTDSRRLFSGRLLVMIGAGDEAGEIRLRLRSPGLEEAVLAIPVLPADGAAERRHFDSLCESRSGEEQIFLRRIDLQAMDSTRLTPEHPEVTFAVAPVPVDAMPQEIAFRITNAEGVDLPCAALRVEGNRVTVTAKGDGEVWLRATANNGYPHPRIISSVEICITGFGPVGLDPYSLIAGSLADIREGDIGAGNDRGISFARESRSMAGFTNVDFGPEGSDTITLPVFALDGELYEIGLWDGIPGQGGEQIAVLRYQKPSIWNTYQPETWHLPKALRGVHTLCFTLDRKIHLKGFSFARQYRALRRNAAAEADHIYGDSCRIDGEAVRDIGNNVTLVWEPMRFPSAGRWQLVLEGRTPLAENPVHVRFRDSAGGEHAALCPFRGDGGAAQVFPVEVPEGACAVSLVFLPGSRFDLESFRFEPFEPV